MSRPPSPVPASHNALDILLNADTLVLRDSDPVTLRGNVVLHLAEATPFKDITMHFRGKSRVPNVQSDGSSVLGGSFHTNVFFTHDWSFLQGDHRHHHTLQAGRHIFPFHLQLDPSLPSSLSAHAGLAGVNYKLRATAIRTVFAANLHAFAPVRLLRSFAPEALEYQQTLEVENTWPEKLMYSLMVPHKAWAAGDTISTLVKFSPLLKGIRVGVATTTVQENIKTYTRIGSPHEESRVIATAKHEIRDGHAVILHPTDSHKGALTRTTSPWSTPSSSSIPLDGNRTPVESVPPLDHFSADAHQIFGGVPIMSSVPIQSPDGSVQTPSGSSRINRTDEGLDRGEEEVVTTLPLTLPEHCTPTHALEPFMVSHRIRWSILLSNPDGHTSELRCSLPLHILDHALLDEARRATLSTRRLLFGLEDPQVHLPDEIELPSYPAHVLDRIANAHVPPTLRVPPTSAPHCSDPPPGSSPPAQLSPALPTSADGPALDWVNSELHRLGRTRARQASGSSSATTPPDSTQTSRHGSRASSPHHNHHHHGIFSLKPFTKVLHPKDTRHHAPDAGGSASGSSGGPSSPALDEEQLSRAFSEVPHYDVASRGFLGGGVTPLSSMRGLPSYEEAERSHSEGDLAARFAAAARSAADPAPPH